LRGGVYIINYINNLDVKMANGGENQRIAGEKINVLFFAERIFGKN
jgi:hypothetical protein